jgi:hypothetical protein
VEVTMVKFGRYNFPVGFSDEVPEKVAGGKKREELEKKMGRNERKRKNEGSN